MLKKYLSEKNNLIASVLIILGIFLLIIALIRWQNDQARYNSPFDQLDQEGSEYGLLPILLPIENTGNPEYDSEEFQAPVIEVTEYTNLDEIELTQVEELAEEVETQSNLQGTQAVEQPGSTPVPTLEYKFTPEADQSYPPTYISIPAIDLRAPIVEAEVKTIEYKFQEFQQWVAPDEFAVGWHSTSAMLNEVGNTVLTGHHNSFGEVFRDLNTLENGDLIYLYSGDQVFTYVVGFKTILNERFETVEKRIENASWILPSDDERITLITCWPYESNTHRVIVVAVPVEIDLKSDLE